LRTNDEKVGPGSKTRAGEQFLERSEHKRIANRTLKSPLGWKLKPAGCRRSFPP
jgi:hypothetical protein